MPGLTDLKNWRGWSATQQAVESRGLGVPAAHQNWMQTFAAAHATRADLSEYWSEVAAEWVTGGGRHDPHDRRQEVVRPYRSTYLDQLTAESQDGRRGASHPALLGFHKENRLSHGQLLADLRAEIRVRKLEEAARAGESGAGWTGRKGDLAEWIDPAADARGFARVTRKRWMRIDPQGLKFIIELDAGGGPELLHTLPIYFFVQWGAAPDELLRLDDLSLVIAGSEHYAFHEDAVSGAYGLQALVGCFDAFATTFG
jgi:hypothetical protein